MFRRLILSNLAIMTLLLGAAQGSALAASVGGDGYKVSPVSNPLTIAKGTSKTVQVYVTNVSSQPEAIQTIENDFIASSKDDGTPSLLLNGNADPTHGLKQFITIKKPDFELKPNQTETVNVTITIPSTAAAGGYYGAIRFAPSSLKGQRNVNLSASVASLILVTVPGNYIENLSLSNFGASNNSSDTTSSFFTSFNNIKAIAAFSNNGQIQEQPFGKILLLKNGKQIGEYAINKTTPPGNVLPDSLRNFSVNLTGINSIGKYTLEGNFGYGTKGQLLSSSTSFYVVTWPYIAGLIVLMLLIIAGLTLVLKKRK